MIEAQEDKQAGEFITAYKGLNKNFQCRGFQYEVKNGALSECADQEAA